MKGFFLMTTVGAAVLLVSTAVNAQDPWLVRGAFEAGGDELISLTFEDGEREEIEAGGRIHLEVGKQLGLFAGSPALRTELSVGYKYDSVNATNGDLAFNRFTLNAVQYYQYNDKFRLGVGVTYHLSPTLEVDIFGIDDEVEGDDSLGFMLAIDYAFSERVNVGVRATQIDYEGDEFSEISGNSVGIYSSYYF